MLPHDLHEPFAGPTARADALQQFFDLCDRLEELERLAGLSADRWVPEETGRFPWELSGHSEHPAERLARWRSLFASELDQVRATRNAAVHARVSDAELRTATYLAGRLLAFAYGLDSEAERSE